MTLDVSAHYRHCGMKCAPYRSSLMTNPWHMPHKPRTLPHELRKPGGESVDWEKWRFLSMRRFDDKVLKISSAPMF